MNDACVHDSWVRSAHNRASGMALASPFKHPYWRLAAGAGHAMSERAARHIDAGEDRLQLADVARQYYLEDLTQEQIARGMGVSRSQVSRMLKVARERGIVEIRIHHPLRTATRPAAEASCRIATFRHAGVSCG